MVGHGQARYITYLRHWKENLIEFQGHGILTSRQASISTRWVTEGFNQDGDFFVLVGANQCNKAVALILRPNRTTITVCRLYDGAELRFPFDHIWQMHYPMITNVDYKVPIYAQQQFETAVGIERL